MGTLAGLMVLTLGFLPTGAIYSARGRSRSWGVVLSDRGVYDELCDLRAEIGMLGGTEQATGVPEGRGTREADLGKATGEEEGPRDAAEGSVHQPDAAEGLTDVAVVIVAVTVGRR